MMHQFALILASLLLIMITGTKTKVYASSNYNFFGFTFWFQSYQLLEKLLHPLRLKSELISVSRQALHKMFVLRLQCVAHRV